MKIKNAHRQQATLIVDGVGEVAFDEEIEVTEQLGKALTQSKHWHLVQADQTVARKRTAKEE